MTTQAVTNAAATAGQGAPYGGAKQWDYPGTFLAAFPKNAQSTIANLFCNAVRKGAHAVGTIIADVEWDLIQRQEEGCTNCLAPIIVRLHDAVIDPAGDARNFAAFILWRESLSPENKAKLKSQKGREFITSAQGKEFLAAKMATEPPTDAQLKYLVALGCPTVPKTKLEASQLIEQYKKK